MVIIAVSHQFFKELGIEKIDWTGQLNFYFDFCTEEYDYWVEFKALVWKGDLKQIEVFLLEKNWIQCVAKNIGTENL